MKLKNKTFYFTYNGEFKTKVNKWEDIEGYIDFFQKLNGYEIKSIEYWDGDFKYTIESENKRIKPSDIIMFEKWLGATDININLKELRENYKIR